MSNNTTMSNIISSQLSISSNNMPHSSVGSFTKNLTANLSSNFTSSLNTTSIWSTNGIASSGLFFPSALENDHKLVQRFEQLPPTVTDEPIENRFGAIGTSVPTPPSLSDGSHKSPSNQSGSSSSSPFSLFASGLNGNGNSPPDQSWLGALNAINLSQSSSASSSSTTNRPLNTGTPPDNTLANQIPIVRTSGPFACGFCRNEAQFYCNSCNDAMCGNCITPHFTQSTLQQHRIQRLQHTPSPKSSCWFTNPASRTPPEQADERDCPMHYETLQFVCEQCKVIICQGCTLRDHYDHPYILIDEYIKEPAKVIKSLIDKSDDGKRDIKRLIDRVVIHTTHLERDMADVALMRRRDHPRSDEQEQYISEILEKFRLNHQTMFADITSNLRSSLAGMAAVTDDLRRRGAFDGLDAFGLAKAMIEHDNKIDHHLKQYTKVSPLPVDVHDFYYRLITYIDEQQFDALSQLVRSLNANNVYPTQDIQVLINNTNQLSLNGHGRTMDRYASRRAIVARNHQQNNNNNSAIQSFFTQLNQQQQQQYQQPIQYWNSHNIQAAAQLGRHGNNGNRSQPPQLALHLLQNDLQRTQQQASLSVNDMIQLAVNQPMLQPNNLRSTFATHPVDDPSIEPNPGFGQCIYNCGVRVSINHRFTPSVQFANDGCEEGQLSRPWGVCVDRFGQIIIGDRRNNRIQIFSSSGEFKFAFGTKGTGDGELDLPAGVTVDLQNRIIVADKDNHRVQIFSALGRFILKFGSFGRGLGEFQYPWDVATNSIGQIVVSDTRNHRVQMFSAYGHFITKFSFDDIPGPSGLKTNITPRGITFDCNGDILVTDFENHRVMRLDGNLRRVIMIRGREGYGDVLEFNRPSGICCDDKGLIAIADSKNQRIVVYNSNFEFQYVLDLRRTLSTINGTDKDRPSDVALLPDGRIVVLFETSPDSKECSNPLKTFVQVY